MEFLKKLFESGALTWEQFETAINSNGYKLADLSTGNYVSRAKYDDDIKRKDTTISDLNGQIAQRDTDLSNLQTQLTAAGTDNKTKVSELTAEITRLQGDYDTAKNDYEARLAHQAYEFAVRDFANGKKFTSSAAKRDFIREMTAEDLKMKDNIIIGADDFVKAYTEANNDAFVVEAPEHQEEPEPKPTFIKPGEPTPKVDENAFAGMFSFTGVRPHNN